MKRFKKVDLISSLSILEWNNFYLMIGKVIKSINVYREDRMLKERLKSTENVGSEY